MSGPRERELVTIPLDFVFLEWRRRLKSVAQQWWQKEKLTPQREHPEKYKDNQWKHVNICILHDVNCSQEKHI